MSVRAVALVALAMSACRGERAHPSATSSTDRDAPVVSVAPPVPSSSDPSPAIANSTPKCPAPSFALSSAIDAYAANALGHCVTLARGTSHCGEQAGLAIDVERFRASVLPIDEATEARIVRVGTLGKTLGMNPHAFGLVGDSITVSGSFLHAFGTHDGAEIVVDPLALPLLARSDGSSIIDYFRGHEVERFAGKPLDSFDAERAAKVGARASFATMTGDASPVDVLARHIKPAIAIVTFGANDATYRLAPPNELADEFEKNLLGAVARLEARGVVVILENEMRHGDQPGVKACPSDDPVNDWRTAVTTNAIVRRTAEIACREHLPFVDLRYALDGATSFGLGPDAVHLSASRRSAGHFDKQTLDCGYSIRGLVSLMALRDVVAVLERRGVF